MGGRPGPFTNRPRWVGPHPNPRVGSPFSLHAGGGPLVGPPKRLGGGVLPPHGETQKMGPAPGPRGAPLRPPGGKKGGPITSGTQKSRALVIPLPSLSPDTPAPSRAVGVMRGVALPEGRWVMPRAGAVGARLVATAIETRPQNGFGSKRRPLKTHSET